MDKEVKIRIVRSDNKEFNIDGNDWKITKLEGFGEFENDINVVDKAVGDGGIITSSRIGTKDRTITAKSLNKYLNDVLRREADSFFNPKLTYKVYLTYMGITRWAEGTIYKYKIPNDNIHRRMVLTVTFLFPNPYLKSYEDFGEDIASITPMIGFPYICNVSDGRPYGITGGIYNFARQVVLENDGAVETYCKAVFVAKGMVVNPALIIGESYVRVLDTMIEGDVLEMDFTNSPPTVKKNGKNIIGKCDRKSSFDTMILNKGDTVIQFDADDGTNVLQVSIYYNKLYSII
ncbi:MAG: phage tail family protein [Lachnospiraceae bacterium]|nr:phage tail family protein [Lachnospiraceae bacterium]